MDPGLATLKAIHKQLLIDESWTLRLDRGLAWIAHRLAQMMEASQPVKGPSGLSVSLVRVRTIVVEEIQAARKGVEDLVASANTAAVGSAYIFLPEKRRIEAVLAHAVHDETLEDRASQLAAYAILQLCAAETVAPALAKAVQGAVAVREHRERGPRLMADDMLNVAQQVFAPAGRKVSRFANAREMQAVVDFCRDTPYATMGAAADGVCLEVPFGASDTALIELRPREPHPWLGAGLSVATHLPFARERSRLIDMAALLAEAQLKTVDGGGQLGAWGVGEKGDRSYIVWRRFIPNAIYRDRMALDVAMGEIGRAVWVDRFFYPDHPVRNAWDIVSQRLGRSEEA